jgi:hypothetical protein
LCGDPQDLWKNGQYSKVPILMGNTEVEGAVVGLSIIINTTLVNKFNSDFNNALQTMLYFSGSSFSENRRNLNKIVQIYFKNMSQLNSNNSFGLSNVRSIALFAKERIWETIIDRNLVQIMHVLYETLTHLNMKFCSFLYISLNVLVTFLKKIIRKFKNERLGIFLA